MVVVEEVKTKNFQLFFLERIKKLSLPLSQPPLRASKKKTANHYSSSEDAIPDSSTHS